MTESGDFTIVPLVEEDCDELMKLLGRTFFIHEPLNSAVGLYESESDTCPELEEYCTSSLHERISFKAVDGDGKMVGALVNETCPLTEDIGNILLQRADASNHPKFKKILYILARREDGARLWEKFPNDDKFVEVKVAATDDKWRKRGILNALVKETEIFLKQKGVRLLRLDSSSAYSAKSAERSGFTCYYKVRYTDIKMNGEPLIVPEPPHEFDRVYVKELFE